jgi:hypothetical protein
VGEIVVVVVVAVEEGADLMIGLRLGEMMIGEVEGGQGILVGVHGVEEEVA